jgi:hypothetical protein
MAVAVVVAKTSLKVAFGIALAASAEGLCHILMSACRLFFFCYLPLVVYTAFVTLNVTLT